MFRDGWNGGCGIVAGTVHGGMGESTRVDELGLPSCCCCRLCVELRRELRMVERTQSDGWIAGILTQSTDIAGHAHVVTSSVPSISNGGMQDLLLLLLLSQLMMMMMMIGQTIVLCLGRSQGRGREIRHPGTNHPLLLLLLLRALPLSGGKLHHCRFLPSCVTEEDCWRTFSAAVLLSPFQQSCRGLRHHNLGFLRSLLHHHQHHLLLLLLLLSSHCLCPVSLLHFSFLDIGMLGFSVVVVAVGKFRPLSGCGSWRGIIVILSRQGGLGCATLLPSMEGMEIHDLRDLIIIPTQFR